MPDHPTVALTIKDPWAQGILDGTKDVENRTWEPRQTPMALWVHAGRRYDGDVVGLPDRAACALYAGTVCGLITVSSVHHANDCGCGCSPWAQPFQYHWVLAAPVRVTPRPVRGMLGLWQVPQPVLALLNDEVSDA